MSNCYSSQSAEALLAEILPKPSNQLKDQPFAGEAASCNGVCKSGVCLTSTS